MDNEKQLEESLKRATLLSMQVDAVGMYCRALIMHPGNFGFAIFTIALGLYAHTDRFAEIVGEAGPGIALAKTLPWFGMLMLAMLGGMTAWQLYRRRQDMGAYRETVAEYAVEANRVLAALREADGQLKGVNIASQVAQFINSKPTVNSAYWVWLYSERYVSRSPLDLVRQRKPDLPLMKEHARAFLQGEKALPEDGTADRDELEFFCARLILMTCVRVFMRTHHSPSAIGAIRA